MKAWRGRHSRLTPGLLIWGFFAALMILIVAAALVTLNEQLSEHTLTSQVATTFFTTAMGVSTSLIVAVSVTASLDLWRRRQVKSRVWVATQMLLFVTCMGFVSLGLILSVLGLIASTEPNQDLAGAAWDLILVWTLAILILTSGIIYSAFPEMD